MITRTLRACGAVLLAAQASPALGASAGGWSAARTLSTCAGSAGPGLAFPSESPSAPTGPGAVTWAQGPGCTGRSRGAQLTLAVSALDKDERPAKPVLQRLPGAGATGLQAVGASRGRVAVLATVAGASPGTSLLQGVARAPLSVVPLPVAAALPSLARAYLGDSAIATVEPGPAIAVRVERYFQSAFAPAQRIPIGPGPVSALVATMDYRSDVLLAWQQNGAIYAHMLRASGRAEPTQLVGRSAPDPQLRALVSDNDHGMIAWSGAEGSAPAPRTSVRIAFSGAGTRFAGNRLITSFADPRGVARGAGSLGLVRLSTENVMLAWTDAEAGSYVVRAAPAVFAGTRPAQRLSDPGAQSVLADLAAGPAGEAVALWRSAAAAAPLGLPRSELWAARAVIERHGRIGSRAAELVAPAAANADPSLAVDPASDRAVATWLTLGARPSVEYAVGPGASGYRPRPALAKASQGAGGSHSERIAIGAAAVAVAAVTILLLRRGARSRNAGGAASRMRRRR